MKFRDLEQKLIELTKRNINQTVIAEALNVTRSNISKRLKNNSPLNTDEIEKIEKYFGVKLVEYNTDIASKIKEAVNYFKLKDAERFDKKFSKWYQNNYDYTHDFEHDNHESDNDCVSIEYIGLSPSQGSGKKTVNEPEIRKIKLGKDLIKHVLKCNHPENLKIFKAQGDSMEPLIEDGDFLLVDIGRLDADNPGIYLFSINEQWCIKRFRRRIDKVLEIISDNTKYDVELIRPESKIDLKIIGRVIKNLSRGL